MCEDIWVIERKSASYKNSLPFVSVGVMRINIPEVSEILEEYNNDFPMSEH